MGARPFENLLETHHGEIYRYLLRVTARRSDADDLSQETFLRAYRAYLALAPDANVRAHSESLQMMSELICTAVQFTIAELLLAEFNRTRIRR